MHYALGHAVCCPSSSEGEHSIAGAQCTQSPRIIHCAFNCVLRMAKTTTFHYCIIIICIHFLEIRMAVCTLVMYDMHVIRMCNVHVHISPKTYRTVVQSEGILFIFCFTRLAVMVVLLAVYRRGVLWNITQHHPSRYNSEHMRLWCGTFACVVQHTHTEKKCVCEKCARRSWCHESRSHTRISSSKKKKL